MVIFCVCFEDIIVKIKEFSTVSYPIMATDKRSHHGMQAHTGTDPATSAAGERSFLTARRLKTWLRSTMTQERFSNLTILNNHKERTERLSRLDIENEFTDRNSERKRNFGIFKVSDVQ